MPRFEIRLLYSLNLLLAMLALGCERRTDSRPKASEAVITPKRGGQPEAPAVAEEVTVGGSWGEGSIRSLDVMTVRRILASQKGDPRLHKYEIRAFDISVNAVPKGDLHDSDFPERPVGVKNISVVAVADAAIALQKFRGGKRGTWTLTVLPDGSYRVADLSRTPYGARDIAPEKAAIAEVAKELESGDPDRQYEAVRKFKDMKSLSLVPYVLPLLDSEAKVTVPDAGHWDGPTGGGVIPADSTLGAEARTALARVTGPLRDRHSPGRRDGEAVWREWWSEVLETEPFPRVEVEPGEVTTLTALPMNQSWPIPRIDPRGLYVVIGISRLQHPMNGVRSGIRLLEVVSPLADDFIYKVPLDEVNCEPSGLAVGWTENSVGIAWKEYSYDNKLNRVKFLSLDLKQRGGVPVDLGLQRISHMSLCPFGKGNWLLACTSKPDDLDPGNYSGRDQKELFLLVLDSAGAILRRTQPLDLSVAPRFGYHDGVQVVSVVDTPEGPAVAYANKREGAFLLMLNPELGIRRVVQMNDPEESGHGFQPQLAFDGKSLCAVWIQTDNDDPRLFVRTFNSRGDPLSKAQAVAEPARVMARPVPLPDGFVVAWIDSSQTPNQVRLATVGSHGAIGETKIVFDGKAMVNPIGLAVYNGKARMMMYYWLNYPHRMLLKDVALDGDASR